MAGTKNNGSYRESERANGILGGHAYTVISVYEIERNRLVKIRNPHGEKEWNGDFSDRSNKWTESMKRELGWANEDDGIFFMPFDAFIREFHVTWLCVDDDILGRDVHSNIEH